MKASHLIYRGTEEGVQLIMNYNWQHSDLKVNLLNKKLMLNN